MRAARSVSTRRVELPAIDRVTISGFRCTSATRTIIDLARARIPHVRLEAAIDSAVRSGATAPVVLATRASANCVVLAGGAPRRLDELLLDSGGHTILERRFLTLMRTAGSRRQRLKSSTGATVARSRGSTSCSRTTASWSKCQGAKATRRTPSGRGTLSAATSSRTSAARSTSTRTNK